MRTPGSLLYLVLASNLILSGHAVAALSTFNDRASFSANSTGLSTIDFGGIAPEASLEAFNTPAGLTISGVNFVGIRDGGNELYVVDDTFCCAAYSNRGTYVASLASPLASATAGSSRIEVSLSGGVTAFGMDLFATAIGGDSGTAVTDTVQIVVAGETFLVPTVTVDVGNGRVFFGVHSTAPISGFSIAPGAIGAQTDIVDFTFGTAAPIPEPSSYLLMLAGVGLIGYAARRRYSHSVTAAT